MTSIPKYVLITPAKNEEDTIKLVIQSVIRQTARPERWILVSDNSSDDTDLIMKRYANEYDFITYLKKDDGKRAGFGSKARAFMLAYSHLEGEEFSYIGSMDADITLDVNYYSRLINILETNQNLGIGGGEILEMKHEHFRPRIHNRDSVAGAVQMFRRQCFEEIGGYMPTPYGGIDTVAETLARMKGWQVQTFSELKAFHHRRVGGTTTGIIRSRFRYGIRDNHLGVHPVFFLVKCMSRIREKPFFIGSLAWCTGFFYSILKGDERPVGRDFVKFTRSRQMRRMAGILRLKRASMQ